MWMQKPLCHILATDRLLHALVHCIAENLAAATGVTCAVCSPKSASFNRGDMWMQKPLCYNWLLLALVHSAKGDQAAAPDS